MPLTWRSHLGAVARPKPAARVAQLHLIAAYTAYSYAVSSAVLSQQAQPNLFERLKRQPPSIGVRRVS